MNPTREIRFHMPVEKMVEMQNTTDYRKWCDAVGYLSTWNLTFPVVDIYADGETDMVANYSNRNGPRAFTIGAVWHEDHYGFHS